MHNKEIDIQLSISSFDSIHSKENDESTVFSKKNAAACIGGLSHSVEINPELENKSIHHPDAQERIHITLTSVGKEIATSSAPKEKTSFTESVSPEHIPSPIPKKRTIHQKFSFPRSIPNPFRKKETKENLSTKRYVSSPSVASTSYASSSSSLLGASSSYASSSSSPSLASSSYASSLSSSSGASSSSSSSAVTSSPLANAKTLKKLDKLTQLSISKSKKHSKLTDGASVISRALAAEATLVDAINTRLSSLDKDRPLSEQKEIIKKVSKLINRLMEINVALTELPREFYLHSASDNIRTLAGRQTIFTSQSKSDPLNSQAETAFLERADVSVIVNLMKIERSAKGKELIQELAKSFVEKNQTLTIQAMLKTGPSSLLAYIGGPPRDANIRINPSAHLPEDPEQLAKEVEQADSQVLIRQAGTSSALGFPIWADHEFFDLEDTWKYKTTNAALGDVLSGNFSFDKNFSMFYTPLHIEMGHELIHVLHNSLGMSAPELTLQSSSDANIRHDFEHTWHDFEEYMTITGETLTENAIAMDFNLPQRYGHSGVAYSSIVNHNPKIMGMTPRQIVEYDSSRDS